jgi:hypothetical protein
MKRADEKPPEDHWRRRFPELEKKLLDEYYRFKGWNEEGIPTRETLRELDLEYVYEAFVRLGILKEDGRARVGAGAEGDRRAGPEDADVPPPDPPPSAAAPSGERGP